MSENAKAMNSDARSPLAGCAILIVALLVMVFLIVFSTITLFRQFNEIAKFTGDQAQPVAVSEVPGNEAALEELGTRLRSFHEQLMGEGEARLELDVADLNLAIAAYDSFEELRETFHVAEIGEETMRIEMSFPLNGKPRLVKEGESGWITSDQRYLNGSMIARPVMLKQEVVLKLDDIRVPGVQVPREFIEQMSPYRIAERYLIDPVIGPAMAALTRVELKGGALVLSKVAGEVQRDHISDEQVDDAGFRFMTVFGVAACLFLCLVGVVIMVGLKKKAREQGDA